jgi:glycerol-3-phosphate acyltransferase PlsY
MGYVDCIKYYSLKAFTVSLDLTASEPLFNRITAIVMAYLLGSINFGYIIYRIKTGKDIRMVGSKNPGASNIRRFLGWRYYLIVLVLDILKGTAAVLLAKWFTDDLTFIALAGGMAIIGHSYPFWLRFKGGKSVAVTLGVFIPLGIWAVLIFAAVYFSILGIIRIVSIASMSGSFLLFISTLALSYPLQIQLLALFAFLLIVYRHRSNIRRIIAGTETKSGRKEKTGD